MYVNFQEVVKVQSEALFRIDSGDDSAHLSPGMESPVEVESSHHFGDSEGQISCVHSCM